MAAPSGAMSDSESSSSSSDGEELARCREAAMPAWGLEQHPRGAEKPRAGRGLCSVRQSEGHGFHPWNGCMVWRVSLGQDLLPLPHRLGALQSLSGDQIQSEGRYSRRVVPLAQWRQLRLVKCLFILLSSVYPYCRTLGRPPPF
jgi:hypothetical protein